MTDPTVSAGALAQPGRLGPGQPGQRAPQRRLIALDREQIVAAAGVQPLGVRTLTMQGIGGNHDPAQLRQALQDRDEGGDLIAAGHLDLAEHKPVDMVVGGHQLHLSTVGRAGAAQRLAVDGHRLPVLADHPVIRALLIAGGGAPREYPGGQGRL